MRRLGSLVLTTCLLGMPVAAKATLIASDDFLNAAAPADGYQTGNINGQGTTAGTTGYFTGAAGGNPAPTWTSGTGAFQAVASGLTNPLVVNPPTSNDGKLWAAGNANNRWQYRDFAAAPAPASDYYFSMLLTQTSSSYTGTSYAGVGPSRATGQNASAAASRIAAGYVNGAMTLFYSDTSGALSNAPLLTSPGTGTYLLELHVSGSGSSAVITPTLYNASGSAVAVLTSSVNATVNNTDLGSFQGYVSSDFNVNGVIYYDEFRLGTTPSDVIATPEPASAAMLTLAGLIFLRRRRRAI